MRDRFGVLMAVALLLAACGGSPAASVSKADCAKADAQGVILLSAAAQRFDAPCLIAPAGVAFTIRLTNHDGLPHDVAIYDSPSKGMKLFEGDPVNGAGSVDYAIGAMAAGEYFFECTFHPGDMKGTLYVESAASP